MAEKTDNYISKFKPESHFFISPEALSQSDTQSFGPVNENEFRLTSKFTAGGGTRMAYAICKGIVLLQRQSGSTGLVNLILRPFTQPIPGFNIKYFIYRGLAEADFFNGNKVLAATSSTSGFINKINASFIAFHNSTAPGQQVPDFLAKYIGFDPAAQLDNLPLSDFFFKESEYVASNGEFVEKEAEAYELPLINMGSSLGNFHAGECGIDVVLNYGDYRLPVPNDEFVFDLAYARAKEAKILLSNTMTDNQKKLKKEQLFQFLDAAAYFGFHYANGSIAVSGSVKKGEAIYNDIVSKFSFKNRLYLYIQSDRGRSYNFYGNYLINDSGNESLKIGDTEDTLTTEAYATNGWPVIIKNNPQSKVYLQLVTDNNENSMLYGQIASIDNAVKNNFIDAEHLKLPNATDGTPNTFTKPIILTNAALTVGGNALNVASFNILIYQGKANYYIAGQETDDQNVTTDILVKANFFDDVFDLVNAEALLKAGQTSEYSVLSSQKLKILYQSYKEKYLGIASVSTMNIRNSIETNISNQFLNNITYLTVTVDSSTYSTSITTGVITEVSEYPLVITSLEKDSYNNPPNSLQYFLEIFTDISEDIIVNGPIFISVKDEVSDTIAIGLTHAENESILELISINNLINSKLSILPFSISNESILSPEGIYYKKFKIGIIAENNGGTLQKFYPINEIVVYSIDTRFYFTNSYSSYMKQKNIEVNGDINNEIIN